MIVKAEWWMDGDYPVVQANMGGIRINLTREEAHQLQSQVNACLNGIVQELARYFVLDGWGKKYHLVRKADVSDTATALCGTKPRKFYGSEETWTWTTWVLTRIPNGDSYCIRCRAAYERLETATSA